MAWHGITEQPSLIAFFAPFLAARHIVSVQQWQPSLGFG